MMGLSQELATATPEGAIKRLDGGKRAGYGLRFL